MSEFGFMTQEEYDAKYVPETADVKRAPDWFTSPEVLKEWEEFVATQPQTYQPKPDDFVNPEHYRSAGIECIEYQRATSTPEEFQGYLKNCCVKYLHRMRAKDDPLKNLLKAQWYLNRLVEEFKKSG